VQAMVGYLDAGAAQKFTSRFTLVQGAFMERRFSEMLEYVEML
jgi:hypothetical protein